MRAIYVRLLFDESNGQMDQDTQKNAAVVEETTAAAHDLRKEAESLARSIGSFQVARTKSKKLRKIASSLHSAEKSTSPAPRPTLRAVSTTAPSPSGCSTRNLQRMAGTNSSLASETPIAVKCGKRANHATRALRRAAAPARRHVKPAGGESCDRLSNLQRLASHVGFQMESPTTPGKVRLDEGWKNRRWQGDMACLIVSTVHHFLNGMKVPLEGKYAPKYAPLKAFESMRGAGAQGPREPQRVPQRERRM